jgi:hypothetical protein
MVYRASFFRVRVVLPLSQAIWLHFGAVGFLLSPGFPPLLPPLISQPRPPPPLLCCVWLPELALRRFRARIGTLLPPLIRWSSSAPALQSSPSSPSTPSDSSRSLDRFVLLHRFVSRQLDLFVGQLASCAAQLSSMVGSAPRSTWLCGLAPWSARLCESARLLWVAPLLPQLRWVSCFTDLACFFC